MVIILRGCSGSGKSTHAAAELATTVKDKSAVFSADAFFMKEDGYKFDPAQLGTAHATCLRLFTLSLIENKYDNDFTLVVDNTNTTGTEVAPYAALALAWGHELKIITIVVDPVVAHARNVHEVPLKTVKDQYKRLERSKGKFPPWWPEIVIHG